MNEITRVREIAQTISAVIIASTGIVGVGLWLGPEASIAASAVVATTVVLIGLQIVRRWVARGVNALLLVERELAPNGGEEELPPEDRNLPIRQLVIRGRLLGLSIEERVQRIEDCLTRNKAAP